MRGETANRRCTSPSSRMLAAHTARSAQLEKRGKDTFTKAFGPQAWERGHKPRPVHVRGNFGHQGLGSPGRVQPSVARAPASWPPLSSLGRAARPVSSTEFFGSGEEPSSLPAAEVPVGEGGSGKTDVSGPRCCSPARPLASFAGSGSELRGVRSRAGSPAKLSSSGSI